MFHNPQARALVWRFANPPFATFPPKKNMFLDEKSAVNALRVIFISSIYP
jgi:hypothetical protein